MVWAFQHTLKSDSVVNSRLLQILWPSSRTSHQTLGKWAPILLPLNVAWPWWLLGNQENTVGVMMCGFHFKGPCSFCLVHWPLWGQHAGGAACRCSIWQPQLRTAFWPFCQNTWQVCEAVMDLVHQLNTTEWPCKCHMKQKHHSGKASPNSWLTKSWYIIKQTIEAVKCGVI